MTISVQDILEVTDIQQYIGQTVLNVYFYAITSKEADVDYADVRDSLLQGLLPSICAIQNFQLAHTGLIIRNLTNAVDIATYPLTDVVGAVGGEGVNSLVAASFRLVRASALTRHGAKRIGGMSESDLVLNGLASGAVARFTTAADTMGSVQGITGTVSHDFTMAPVIIGRFPQGGPDAGELDISKVNQTNGAQFIRVSSQVTRRAGRGV